ncbi:MAG: hypothetical protein WCD81_12135 [Candidatus Bathyarchaeia archaeon]
MNKRNNAAVLLVFLATILVLSIANFNVTTVKAAAPPSITLLPPAGPVGIPITVNGNGFAPGADISLTWFGNTVDVPGIAGHVATYTIKSGITADQNGNFTTTIISPSDFSDIPHQVNATQNGIGTGIINATFTTVSTMHLSPQPATYANGQQIFLNITGGPLGAAALPITGASEAEVLKFTYDNVMWGFDTSHLSTEGPVATGGFIGWDVGGNISIRFTATGEVGIHTIRAYVGRETVPIWLSCEIGGEVSFNITGPSSDTQTILNDLSNIDAKIVSIQGDVATITTNVGTISGNVTSISNGMATVNTSLGTLTLSVDGVKSSTDNSVNYGLGALILSVIDLVILLAVAALVLRKH